MKILVIFCSFLEKTKKEEPKKIKNSKDFNQKSKNCPSPKYQQKSKQKCSCSLLLFFFYNFLFNFKKFKQKTNFPSSWSWNEKLHWSFQANDHGNSQNKQNLFNVLKKNHINLINLKQNANISHSYEPSIKEKHDSKPCETNAQQCESNSHF